MSRPPFLVSRRTAVGGVAGLGLLAGCGAAATTPPPADTAAQPAEDPDTDLVDQVLSELAIAHHVVQANRRAHPGLSRQLLPLERLHAAHARELDGSTEGVKGAAADPDESDALALTRVGRAEARLERRLVRAAIDADSGALAQVLASMSAGVAQARAV